MGLYRTHDIVYYREEFKISIETDDIIDFSGFKKGKESLILSTILSLKKYLKNKKVCHHI